MWRVIALWWKWFGNGPEKNIQLVDEVFSQVSPNSFTPGIFTSTITNNELSASNVT
jgi:hypothetical protein